MQGSTGKVPSTCCRSILWIYVTVMRVKQSSLTQSYTWPHVFVVHVPLTHVCIACNKIDMN